MGEAVEDHHHLVFERRRSWRVSHLKGRCFLPVRSDEPSAKGKQDVPRPPRMSIVVIYVATESGEGERDERRDLGGGRNRTKGRRGLRLETVDMQVEVVRLITD